MYSFIPFPFRIIGTELVLKFERLVGEAVTKCTSGLKGIDELEGKLISDISKKIESTLVSAKKEVEAELRKAEEDKAQAAAPEREKLLSKSGAVTEERKANSGPLTDKEKLKEFPKRADIMLLNLQFFSQGIEQVKNGTFSSSLLKNFSPLRAPI